jgi:cytidyltransferase-like protein
MQRRAFVSGCFDLLHSGHIEFLQQAATFGRLTVAIGSDATIKSLKGRHPVCSQQERLFMIQALRCVDEAIISTGSGLLDFESELRSRQPDVFVVNTDGDHPAKRALCASLEIEYRVLNRVPARGLPQRSSTSLRTNRIPYRIDLAGGWLDQPFVSSVLRGAVIVASIEPSAAFMRRSGLATSSRATAERLWGMELPMGDPVELAKVLFACENPPGTHQVAGSQDALGIALAGVSRLDYAGEYWPQQIERIEDPATLDWLEQHLFLHWIDERPLGFDVPSDQHLSRENVARLADSAAQCWQAIERRDVRQLGHAVSETFRAQRAMFPQMATDELARVVEALGHSCYGSKLMGAGGGGYVLQIADRSPPQAIPIYIRRPSAF